MFTPESSGRAASAPNVHLYSSGFLQLYLEMELLNNFLRLPLSDSIPRTFQPLFLSCFLVLFEIVLCNPGCTETEADLFVCVLV